MGLCVQLTSCVCMFTANRTEDEEKFCDLFWGVDAGASSSNINEKSEYSGINDGSAIIGPQVGVTVLSPINERLSLEGGLRYAGKGNKTSFEDSDGEENYNYSDKTRLNYLDVPLLARYKVGQGGFGVYAGVQPSLLLSAKRKSEGTGSENQTADVKDSYKSLDMAGSVGVGYAFGNGFQINAGYDHGFTNIADNNSFGTGKIRNRTFKLTLGYRFGTKK